MFGQQHGIEQVLDFARLTAADIETARVGSGFVSQLQQFNVGAAHVPHIDRFHGHLARCASDSPRRGVSDTALLVHIRVAQARSRGSYGIRF